MYVRSKTESESVTFYFFYGVKADDLLYNFMVQLNSFMIDRSKTFFSSQGKKDPIQITISLENVTYIEATAEPILLSILCVLKQFYEKTVILILPRSNDVKKFLYTTKFYDNSTYGLNKECLFIYNQQDSVSFDDYEKKYNPKNIVVKIPGANDYYEKDKEERKKIKYERQDIYKNFLSRQIFGDVIERVFKYGTDEYYNCIGAISELMCNSELYSLSDSYANFQMENKTKYNMSLSDNGIGFVGSLAKKEINPIESKEHLDEYNRAQIETINSSYLDDFFALFTAFSKSDPTERLNLWNLIIKIVDNNGKFLIHSGRVRIKFDDQLCYNDIYTCMNSIISKYKVPDDNSPLIIYPAKLPGVHIRIVFEGIK